MKELNTNEANSVSGGSYTSSGGGQFTQARTDAYGNTAYTDNNISEILVIAAKRTPWLSAVQGAFNYGPSAYDSWFNNYERSFYEWDGYDTSDHKPVELMGRNDASFFSETNSTQAVINEISFKKDQSLAPNTLAAISKWSYDFDNFDNINDIEKYTNQVPTGYSVLASVDNQQNGFYGLALYQESTGDVIFTFRGTNEGVDWVNNAALGAPGANIGGFTQDESAVTLLSMVIPHLNPGTDVYFTGHSLGGALAAFSGAYVLHQNPTKFNVEIVTFGSAPFTNLTSSHGIQNSEYSSKLTNFYRQSDPLLAISTGANFANWSGFAGNNIVYQGSNNAGSPIDNHSINRYMSEVSNDVFALNVSAADIMENDPIFLDLDGGGINLAPSSNASVKLDFDGDGTFDHVRWVRGGDGVLVEDWNHDGKVSGLSEVAFGVKYGFSSDLQALSAFDSNGDGVFDKTDSRYGDFRIWKDINSDGIFADSELLDLDDAGVASISLDIQLAQLLGDGYRVANQTTVLTTEGDVRTAWDVRLRTVDHRAA